MTHLRAACSAVATALAISVCGAQNPSAKGSSLDQFRAAIEEFRQSAGKTVDSPLELAGYSFDWELRTGGDFTVVVISRNLKGQVAIFASDGGLTTSRDIGEVQSVQLCDLDDDGVSEIITDEVREVGTGLLTRYFGVYRASKTAVDKLWDSVSFGYLYHEDAKGKSYFSSAVGYLRCDPSGGDRPRPRLIYASATDDGRGKKQRGESSVEIENGKVVVRAQLARPSAPRASTR
jgi:hypothetical protein